MAVLEARYYSTCRDRYGNYYNCNSAWSNWARWLVLGLVIFVALVIFFLFSCLTARRRRRMGNQPYRGTAWALGRTPPGHGAAQYNSQQQPYYANNNNSNAPPVYNNSNKPAPPPYQAAGTNQGYYAPQQETNLQQPQATYGGYGQSGYVPPAGPPPGR